MAVKPQVYRAFVISTVIVVTLLATLVVFQQLFPPLTPLTSENPTGEVSPSEEVVDTTELSPEEEIDSIKANIEENVTSVVTEEDFEDFDSELEFGIDIR